MNTQGFALCGQWGHPQVGCAGCCYNQNIQIGPKEWNRIYSFITKNKKPDYVDRLIQNAQNLLDLIDPTIGKLTSNDPLTIARATTSIRDYFENTPCSLKLEDSLSLQIFNSIFTTRNDHKVKFYEAFRLTEQYMDFLGQQTPGAIIDHIEPEILEILGQSLLLQVGDFGFNERTGKLFFGQSIYDFLCRRLGALLTPLPTNNPCVFLDPNTYKCTIYPVRPSICQLTGMYSTNENSSGCSPNLMLQSLYGKPNSPYNPDYFFRLLSADLPFIPSIVRVLTSQF